MNITQDYRNGYTKALLDMYQIFSQYEKKLSSLRVISAPSSAKIRKIIDAMIQSRDHCMRYGVKSLTLVQLKD